MRSPALSKRNMRFQGTGIVQSVRADELELLDKAELALLIESCRVRYPDTCIDAIKVDV